MLDQLAMLERATLDQLVIPAQLETKEILGLLEL